MGNWMRNIAIDYVLKFLSHDKLMEWASLIKKMVLPFLYEQKEKLLNDLKARAEKTKTPIDDTLVSALDKFLDAFFPDNDVKL